MKWDNLTMSQKQALMKIYVNNGVTNLDEIVNHYNRYAEGGSKETVESPNAVMYSRTPRELVGNAVNTRPVPGLITMTEVPRIGAGVNIPITETINNIIARRSRINTPTNVVSTDSIVTRTPISYIGMPTRINKFEDGGNKNSQYSILDATIRAKYKLDPEILAFWDYAKSTYGEDPVISQELIDLGKESPEYIYWNNNYNNSKANSKLSVSNVVNSIYNNIESTRKGMTDLVEKQQKEKEEKLQQDLYNYKLMGNSLATAAELTSAAYSIGQFMKAKNILPNSRIVNNRFLADENQVLMSGLGTAADTYQLFTNTTPSQKLENGLELTGDVAGIIGGTNWFRNTPFFGRYGNTIDNVLDFAGYTAAGYDGIVKPTYGLIKYLSKDNNDLLEKDKKKYGGKIKKNKK